MGSTKTSHNSQLRLYPIAVVLGVTMGAIASLFLWLIAHLKDIVWPHHGHTETHVFVFGACVLGGAIVGIINVFAEKNRNSAHDLNEAFADAESAETEVPPSTQIILGRAALGITSLGFGGPLGPEAPLISLGAQLSSRFAGVLRISREQAVRMSLAGALGALFVAPLAGVAVQADVVEGQQSRMSRITSMGPEIIAGLSAFIVFLKLLPDNNSGPFSAPSSVDPGISMNLLWCGIAALLAAGLGLLTEWLVPIVRSALVRFTPGGPIVLGTVGGAILGIGAVITPLVLFSGHHETQALLDGGHSTLSLVALSLLKVLLVVVCLSGGWFGGQIFPMAFAGAAIALAFGQLVNCPSIMALAASGFVAACVVSLRKPVLVLLIFIFLFPMSVWLSMAIAMAVAIPFVPSSDNPLKSAH